MKHPTPSTEVFEFNIGRAPDLRCTNHQRTTICGKCEACILTKKLNQVKGWFFRAGDQTKRRFALGLLRRLHSVDILQHVMNLLQPLQCKDFVYARSRTVPSLETDRATMSSDRALNLVQLERDIAELWYWFQSANYWSKSNFLLSLLQECDAQLLHLVSSQVQTLLASERRAFIPTDDYEASSVASSSYTFCSEDYPELKLLAETRSEYSVIPQSPFVNDVDSELENEDLEEKEEKLTRNFSRSDPHHLGEEIINDDSGDEEYESLNPICMIIPSSTKAYSGVSLYKDFIRSLPVHLSKMILGLLDRVSLNNCICVNQHWRQLAEEVHQEFYINQHLKEEVMLMQGASAQGCNPIYAKDVDVFVPNVIPGTRETLQTEEDIISTTYKSEVSFTTAYSGYSTRRIIMEERNVYCGAYNVMVLTDQADNSRVIHTDGGKLIAMGFGDRKVRFINRVTGREVEPVITGHAGSVRCVAVNENEGFVLSGSYDTSIRCWSLETGKCLRIYRGHRDSVMCISTCGDMMVSGARDNLCKVWYIANKKCVRTFKHKAAVMAVAMDIEEEKVISGCEKGQVKVWHLHSGKLIKMLSGHHNAVTAIKFDRWHIITGSRDGYALVWSSQGDHSRCLNAFRHPKDVLCLEFMYLRVITGCADGKLRIWNMLTGDCLRIMRGNSRSDPITALIAIGNRLTLNTSNTLLELNFEEVTYDYTLENDKVPSLVRYSKYSDTPIRQQPYPYVRAQRMARAGASNTKIVRRESPIQNEVNIRQVSSSPAAQTPHSARTLSQLSMLQAQRAQSACSGRFSQSEMTPWNKEEIHITRPKTVPTLRARTTASGGSSRSGGHSTKFQIHTKKSPSAKTRFTSARSGTHSVSIGGVYVGHIDDDSDADGHTPPNTQRRMSYAFQKPQIPCSKNVGLSDMKSLLRSQIRAHEETVPPDFIYLSVNAVHASQVPQEAEVNLVSNRRERIDIHLPGRPSSSPGRIDPRTKVPVRELELDQIRIEHGVPPADTHSVAESNISKASQISQKLVHVSSTEVEYQSPTQLYQQFEVTPTKRKAIKSHHASRILSSIPRGHIFRPHTADPGRASPLQGRQNLVSRPKSAEPSIVWFPDSSNSRSYCTTSASKPNVVPILMYPDKVQKCAEALKEKQQGQRFQPSAGQTGISVYNLPLRTHQEFTLQTHQQVTDQLNAIKLTAKREKEKLQKEQDRAQKARWLARVRVHGPNKPASVVGK